VIETPPLNLQEQLMSEHRQWLTGFDCQHLKSWEDQLSDNPEAALCEAAVRDIMQASASRSSQ
jgi:hypothetical protein